MATVSPHEEVRIRKPRAAVRQPPNMADHERARATLVALSDLDAGAFRDRLQVPYDAVATLDGCVEYVATRGG